MSNTFDLIVFGQITLDNLYVAGRRFQRIGGAAYAVSAAARLGSRVGLLASATGPSPETACDEMQRRGVDVEGISKGIGLPLIYEVQGVDELAETTVLRTGPSPWELPFPETIPDPYRGARYALVYPVWMPAALAVVRQLRAAGTRIAADVQHDVESLAEAHDLLALCDYVFLNTEALLLLTDAVALLPWAWCLMQRFGRCS